jgi:hypothetical protein
MKNKLLVVGSVALFAALVLLGCPDSSGDDVKNTGALITSVSVAGAAVEVVPQPVAAAEWNGTDFAPGDLESGKAGQVVVGQGSALASARIDVTASAGAKLRYAAVSYEKPESFQDGNTISLSSAVYLVIQVTSEDGNTVNYYVVEINVASGVATLSAVTVGDVTAALGTPNADYSQAVAGTANLGGALTGKKITVTKGHAGQTVKFAKVTGTGAPEFTETDTYDFADGDFLYIEVTAENGSAKNIYKIEIWGVRAEVPVISPAELPNATYQINDGEPAALEVTVSLASLEEGEEVPATSAFTYQWYSNAQDSNTGGTAVEGATEASFTPPVTALGKTWYYVEVTHTDSTISAAPARAVSTAARITVVQEVEKVESVVAGSSNTVAYRFTLPDGKKWSDYTKITWQVLVDDLTTINMAATRAHIMGNYQESAFSTTTGVWQKLSGWNDARLVTISNSGAMSAILGGDYVAHTWKTLEYSIAADNSLKDGSYDAETYYPADAAAGPFYFGIGLSVNPNNNANGVCRYFVRGMALSNDDGTDKVPADPLTDKFGETGLTLMDLKCIFNQNTEIERSLVNNPVPDEEE